jgi:hypothetical protein
MYRYKAYVSYEYAEVEVPSYTQRAGGGIPLWIGNRVGLTISLQPDYRSLRFTSSQRTNTTSWRPELPIQRCGVNHIKPPEQTSSLNNHHNSGPETALTTREVGYRMCHFDQIPNGSGVNRPNHRSKATKSEGCHDLVNRIWSKGDARNRIVESPWGADIVPSGTCGNGPAHPSASTNYILRKPPRTEDDRYQRTGSSLCEVIVHWEDQTNRFRFQS